MPLKLFYKVPANLYINAVEPLVIKVILLSYLCKSFLIVNSN